MANDREIDVLYHVVVNQQLQYSILAAHQAVPDGWRTVGVSGSRDECLDHIESVWTDMNPVIPQILPG